MVAGGLLLAGVAVPMCGLVGMGQGLRGMGNPTPGPPPTGLDDEMNQFAAVCGLGVVGLVVAAWGVALWPRRREKDVCQECRHDRGGLDATRPCPKCGDRVPVEPL